MKKTACLFALAASFTLTAAPSHAEETWGEKGASKGRDAKRAVKRGVNRVDEAFCMEGDVKCAAEKAGHRMEETADTVKDKARGVKDKVD